MAKLQHRWSDSWLVRIVSSLAAFSWFSLLILWVQYDYTRPTSSQPSVGRTYELDTHGHVVFLTHSELSNLYILGLVGAAFLFIAIVARLSNRKSD